MNKRLSLAMVNGGWMCVMFFLSGCAGKAPPVVLLSLPSVAAPAAASPMVATSQAKPSPLIIVRRIQIPEYLQSAYVRYRDSAQTLAEWPATRWAERLEVGMTRHLTQQLNSVLKAGAACDTACIGAAHAVNLSVSYQTLDAQRHANVMQAQISWWMTPASGEPPANGLHQLTLSEPIEVDSAAGHADALARVNAQLARQIAASLRP